MTRVADHADHALGRMLRGAACMLAAEGAARVTRLGAALALAWMLSPAAFGAAALIMTVSEIGRAPTRNGVLQSIARASEAALPAVAGAAARLNWITHLVLGAAQAALAWPLALWMGAPEIAWPLIALTPIYLLYPLAFPRVALLYRTGRMGDVARLTGASLSLANALTMLLALCGFGLWSVVLPRLASAALWVWMARRAHPTPPASAPGGDGRAIWRYGRAILGAEMIKAATLHLDKILVGKILGMEALGLYAFAFNAGLGLSLAALKGFADALFPYLCAQGRDGGALRADAARALKAALIAALILFPAQAVAAQWYVPLLFGAQWAPAVLPLAILCLSAIPRPLWETTAQILRAEGRPDIELSHSSAFAVVFLSAVAAGASAGGVIGAAAACLVVHVVFAPAFAWSALRASSRGAVHV